MQDHEGGGTGRQDGGPGRWRAVFCTVLLAVAAGLAWTVGAAQSRAPVMERYRQGAEAMRKKDYAAAVQHLSAAVAGAPSHPGLMAELARAEALSGVRDAALVRLEAALKLGSGLDVVDDPSMAPTLAGDAAGPVRRAAEALRTPVSTSHEGFRLAQRDLIPEGIAYDPVGKHFYVGSIHRRKIVRVDAAGRATDFVREGQDGLLAVLGMKVDIAGRTLWAATEGTLSMRGGTKDDVGRSALVQFDLRTGSLLKKVEMRPDPAPHLFNDVALDRAGNVYVTDSEHGSVWRLPRGGRRLEPLGAVRSLEYPNGIALSSDESRLFVAHLAGIGVFDLVSGARTSLPHVEGLTLTDIDGLYRVGHRLVAVQNGLVPPRIVVFDLTGAEDRVVGAQVLERGHPLFASIPTTGVIVDGWFYYIANAQLRAFTPDNRVLPPGQLQETVVLRARFDSGAPADGRPR
jgi:DNA-binding beta-propeller fold protein YncE